MNVGFIGVGYMGYGIAKNILKKGNNLFVIANKKRAPIDKIVSDGAIEVKSYNELCEKNLDALFLCVTNTPIALSIAEKVSTLLKDNTLIIDVTTHNQNGSIQMEQIFSKQKINYINTPSGFVQHQEFWFHRQPFSEHDLLLIASRKEAGHLFNIGCLDLHLLDRLVCDHPFGRFVQKPFFLITFQAWQTCIFPNRHG